MALDTLSGDVLSRLSIGADQVQTVTPQLLTYLRGLNYDVSSLESNRTRSLAQIGADKAYQEQKLGIAEGLQRRNLAAGFLQRGTPGSSEASRAIANERTAEGFGRSDLAQNIADRQAGAQDIYDTGMSTLRRGALENILSTDTSEAIRKASEAATTAGADKIAKAQGGVNDTLIAGQKAQQDFYTQMLAQIQGLYATPGAMPTVRMGSGPVGSGNETMAGILPEYNIAGFKLSDYLPPAVKVTTPPKTPGFTYGAPQRLRGAPY